MRSQPTTFEALKQIVTALDEKFPDGNDIFQRISRLCEETGELAAAVNHRENMGIKNEKHGKATDAQLLKEMQDVLRAVIGIAKHYHLEDKLERDILAFYRKYQQEGRITYKEPSTPHP